MTTQPQAVEAILQHWATAWAATTPYGFDNEVLDPPPLPPWARVTVRHTAGNQETLGEAGNRKFASFGTVFVQLFDRLDQGRAALDILAQQAKIVFQGTRITGTTVRFLNVFTRDVGRDDDLFQIAVEANFEYDETR